MTRDNDRIELGDRADKAIKNENKSARHREAAIRGRGIQRIMRQGEAKGNARRSGGK